MLLKRDAARVAQQLAHNEAQVLGHEHEGLRALEQRVRVRIRVRVRVRVRVTVRVTVRVRVRVRVRIPASGRSRAPRSAVPRPIARGSPRRSRSRWPRIRG